MLNGIVLVCNKEFQIQEFVYNSFENKTWEKTGISISDICDSDEKNKVAEFTKKLTMDGVTFNWEINVTFKDHLKPLKFSGSRIDKNFFIFALETNSDVPFLYEELMRINNEQSNFIRKILKEKFIQSKELANDNEALDELTKLNNELANLQRELSKKNVELSKLNKIKNQFLGMAAHDLRNPLGNVYNYAELLEDEPENLSDSQKRFIAQIKNQSLFMVNLVNDLLDYSAIESGEVNLATDKHDLVDTIAETVILVNSLAARKEIKINFRMIQASIMLRFDRDKIEQVITNLITNAIKYSQPNNEIYISISENKEEYLIEVKDRGEGIIEEELPTLFKPFNRTSTRATGGEKSTGLGLFICKRIIDAHNGRIWATSKVGVGSSFYFSLPKPKTT